MPRFSDHLVKSAIRLLRQSTTVPNTSNTSAFTAEISDMSAPCLLFSAHSQPRHSGMRQLAQARNPYSRSWLWIPGSLASLTPRNDDRPPSIEVEFLELAMIGLDVTHRAGDRAHHHGLGLDHVLAEFDARQQRAGGNPGCRKQAVTLCHVLDAVNCARIGDAHLAGTLAL